MTREYLLFEDSLERYCAISLMGFRFQKFLVGNTDISGSGLAGQIRQFFALGLFGEGEEREIYDQGLGRRMGSVHTRNM